MINNSKYYLHFTLLTALVFLAIFLGRSFAHPGFVNEYAWAVALCMAVLTVVSHFFLSKLKGKDALDTNNLFMASNAIRIVGAAVFIFLYFYKVKVEAESFLLNFFIIYFVYTFFEIRTLISNLRPRFKKDQEA